MNQITLSLEEKEFLQGCISKNIFPLEFLVGIRLKRRKWTRQFFDNLPAYEQALEIADERAIVVLPNMESISPYDPDPRLLDAMAARYAQERQEAFKRFLQYEKNGGI